VSGLCLGVVVVEAARRSGSLITARFAAEQGREVFAVPGSPLDPRAEGTNDLIRDGATLCADPDHVITALAPLIGREAQPGGAWNDRPVDLSGEPLWEELEGLDIEPPPAVPIQRDYLAQGLDPDGDEAEGIHEASPDGGPLADGHSPHGRHLLALLGPQPVLLDDLGRLSGLAAREIQRAIVELELGGYVLRHANNSVSLK
ncbi:DNA-processing protein DprA, partial [Chelatococcus sp.]